MWLKFITFAKISIAYRTECKPIPYMDFIDEESKHFQTSWNQTTERLKNGMRNLRKSRELTQLEMADLLGVTRETVASVETGKQPPSVYLLFRIAYLYKMSLTEFLTHCSRLEL